MRLRAISTFTYNGETFIEGSVFLLPEEDAQKLIDQGLAEAAAENDAKADDDEDDL